MFKYHGDECIIKWDRCSHPREHWIKMVKKERIPKFEPKSNSALSFIWKTALISMGLYECHSSEIDPLWLNYKATKEKTRMEKKHKLPHLVEGKRGGREIRIFMEKGRYI